MDYKDYYGILGVPRGASQADIRKAFRKLAREHHPDMKPGDRAAEQRFKDINEANAVLSDPAKRTQYDALGANWEAFSRAGAAGARGAAGGTGGAADPFGPGGPFAGYRPAGGNVRYEFRTSGSEGGAGFSDFFRMFFGGGAPAGAATSRTGEADGGAGRTAGGRRGTTGADATFEEILAGLDADEIGGAGRTRSAARRAGGPLEVEVDVSLEEAFHGSSRLVEIDGRRLEVTVPRGVDTGSRIRLPGKGPDGRDVHLVTRVRPHPVFTRNGADLTRDLPITLEEALLGAEVPVTTLRGRVLLTIPPGTQNGRTFRLTGQGMPRLRREGSGDLYVKTRVVLPTAISPEAMEQARRLFELVEQPDPRAT